MIIQVWLAADRLSQIHNNARLNKVVFNLAVVEVTRFLLYVFDRTAYLSKNSIFIINEVIDLSVQKS